jgi:hypothetical protein
VVLPFLPMWVMMMVHGDDYSAANDDYAGVSDDNNDDPHGALGHRLLQSTLPGLSLGLAAGMGKEDPRR